MKIKKSKGERAFQVFNYAFLTLIMLVCLYPVGKTSGAGLSACEHLCLRRLHRSEENCSDCGGQPSWNHPAQSVKPGSNCSLHPVRRSGSVLYHSGISGSERTGSPRAFRVREDRKIRVTCLRYRGSYAGVPGGLPDRAGRTGTWN